MKESEMKTWKCFFLHCLHLNFIQESIPWSWNRYILSAQIRIWARKNGERSLEGESNCDNTNLKREIQLEEASRNCILYLNCLPINSFLHPFKYISEKVSRLFKRASTVDGKNNQSHKSEYIYLHLLMEIGLVQTFYKTQGFFLHTKED